MAEVLVTGASSQIGLYLLAELESAGHRVAAVSRDPDEAQRNLERLGLAARPRWIVCDLKAPPAKLPPLAAEALIHAAPIYTISALLDSPATAGLSTVVAFSSTSIEGKQATRSPKEKKMLSALRAGEDALRNWTAGATRRAVVLRPTLVYGAAMDRNVTRIARFIRRFRFFPMLGKGFGQRQPVHAQDLARAAVHALQSGLENYTVYALSGDDCIAYTEMVRRIFSSLGLRPRIVHLPAAPVRTALRVLETFGWNDSLSADMLDRIDRDLIFDSSLARQQLGFKPRGFWPTAKELGA